METEVEVPAEAVLCAVVAHAGATLGARDVASAAAVSDTQQSGWAPSRAAKACKNAPRARRGA